MRKYYQLLLLTLISLLAIPAELSAQIVSDAIKWESKVSNSADGKATITMTGKLKSGWHVYDMNLPEGGPTSTALDLSESKGVIPVDEMTADRAAKEVYDENFGMKLRWFDADVTLTQIIQITDAKNFKIVGDLIYQTCSGDMCLPPEHYEFTYGPDQMTTAITSIPDDVAKEVTPTEVEGDESESSANTAALAGTTSNDPNNALWTPVVEELRSFGDRTLEQASGSLWMVFIYGFLGGLVALLTPCVWPMIPMTVSFFLKRTKSRSKAIGDAITYGLAIIVIYLAMGLTISGIFGASALNDLSTNAIFNIIFFLLLVVFAISFFGAFELVLPQKWTNKLDAKADSTSGILSIFFMAFTLVLVSFSCTGPIIGTLLVQASTMGTMIGPAIGMFGFALALSIPFAFFAIFPNYLQNMPKSGGWLNSVKVVLGFLELALALKFLSVADLAYGWRILDREVFVSLWIVIFILLGAYLLGKIRFSHDSPLESVSVTRLFLSIISFAFAIYMLPGLWGAPLKAISAFAPPLYTQDFNLYKSEVHAQFDDYDAAMAYAKSQNKPVMIDFAGYGCVNCRKMEASVWTDPKVKSRLEEDFILVTLIVDDKTKLPEPIVVEENGKTRKLKTIGDKWSYLQRHKFGSNAQPFYVMIDSEGKPLGPSYGYNEDVSKYIDFLDAGLKNFKERQK